MPRFKNQQTIPGLFLEEYPTSLTDVLRARATEAFTRNITPSLIRTEQLERAEGTDDVLIVMEGVPIRRNQFRDESQFSPFVSIEEANRQGSALGLSFQEPIREDALNLIITRKRKERIRQSVLASGPQNFTTSSLGFFTELLTTVADPLNVALAFVPVVGEARYAQLVGRFGATRARAITGAVEGTVGGLLAEPVILEAANREQADYDFMDSLLNVTFGTVVGGGLHVTVGKVGDVLANRRLRTNQSRVDALVPELKEAAIRLAVSALDEDKFPSVRSLLDESAAFNDSVRLTRASDASARLTAQADRIASSGFLSLEPASSTASEIVLPLNRLIDDDIVVPRTAEEIQQQTGLTPDEFQARRDAVIDDESAIRVSVADDGTVRVDTPDDLAKLVNRVERGVFETRVYFDKKSVDSGKAEDFVVSSARRDVEPGREEVTALDRAHQVETPQAKLALEKKKLESADSDLFSIKTVSPEEDIAVTDALKSSEELSAEMSDSDFISDLKTTMAGIDDEVLEAVGLSRDVESSADVLQAAAVEEKSRLVVKAAEALAACLRRG